MTAFAANPGADVGSCPTLPSKYVGLRVGALGAIITSLEDGAAVLAKDVVGVIDAENGLFEGELEGNLDGSMLGEAVGSFDGEYDGKEEGEVDGSDE